MMTVKFIIEDDENEMIHVEHDGHEVWSDTARDAWDQYFRHVMPRGVPVLLTTDAHETDDRPPEREGDDRPYPQGESTDARLARWLADNTDNPALRLDAEEGDGEPVTMTRSEIGFLLYCVAERFYWHGADDVRARLGMPS